MRDLHDQSFAARLMLAQPLKENRFQIPKSRYASVSLYISDVWYNRPEYNDIYAPYDRDIFERLRSHGESVAYACSHQQLIQRSAGIDTHLSRHISHLFIRDPLVIFSETIDQDDTTSNDHFEVSISFIRSRRLTHCVLEHPIHKLANCALQATSSELSYRLARRVPIYGSPAHRLRKRGFCSVHRPPITRDLAVRLELLSPHIQGL